MVKISEKFYGYMDSPLGVLEIICSDEALISVKYLEKTGQNKKNILVEKVVIQLSEYFDGVRKIFDLPLGISGTEFQKQAWQVLLSIPFAETISYKEQADRAGNPKAIRAVGLANGKNNINIIIPCHRVVGQNGELRGYIGGLSRKNWLLEHEKRNK